MNRRRLVLADADGAGWKTLQNRRQGDIQFLEQVRAADLGELLEMLKALGPEQPEWRRVALHRRLALALNTKDES